MRDLEVYEIPVDKYKLVNIDPSNKEHKQAIKKFRDKEAKKMMYDLKYQFNNMKKNQYMGNPYLIKDENEYVGFVTISNADLSPNRSISMMIKKEFRGKGLGKVILTGVGDYLLDNNYADNLFVYIKDKNIASINMAKDCGFELDDSEFSKDTSIYRRKK